MFGQAIPQSERLLSEIANKIKTTNHELCCISELLDGGSTLIPVYEYHRLSTDGPTTNSSDNLYFTITGTRLTLNFKVVDFDVNNFCDGFVTPHISDSVESSIYEDSLGRTFISQTTTPIIADFANFPNLTITLQYTIELVKGFRHTFQTIISTDNTGVPSLVTTWLPVKSNSNLKDKSAYSNSLAYEQPIADLLEVWKAGVFIKYIDLDHNDYVPTQCLSYDPVLPFKDYVVEPLTGIYNTPQLISVNNSTETIVANSVHSIHYFVTAGTPTITINGVAITLAVGDKDTIEGTGLLNLDVEFTCGSGDTIVLTITKP